MKAVVNKWIALFGILGIMGLFTGCTDTPTDSGSNTTTQDDFSVLNIDLSDDEIFDEIPALNVLMDPGANLTGYEYRIGDDHPDGTSDRRGRNDKGGRDGKKPPVRPGDDVKRVSYARIIAALELTDAQKESARECFAAHKECVTSAKERYQAARRELADDFHSSIDRLKAAVEAGDITPEDARATYKELVGQYRTDAQTLKEAFGAALKACHESFVACITSLLTDEQLAKWEELTSKMGG